MSDASQHFILDASALIALLSKEPGSAQVIEVLPHSIMSAVNIAEVAKFLKEKNNLADIQIRNTIYSLIYQIFPFDDKLAFLTAEILEKTKSFGLSLGDRCCIALGISTQYTIYTADKAWANLDIPNLKIHLIR